MRATSILGIAIGVTACASQKADEDSAWPEDNYPPELPLDPQFTSCEDDVDCVVLTLGACQAFPVVVNCESAEEVWCRFSQRVALSRGCDDGSTYGLDGEWTVCTDGTCGWGRV